MSTTIKSVTVATSLWKRLEKSDPVKLVVNGYLIYIIAGMLLLLLPFAVRLDVSFLDTLFVATSAVSTTGLSPVDVGTHFTFFGQLVILVLIQLGGIGYMTFSSFVILTSKRKLSEKANGVATTVFSIPDDFKIEKFIVSVILFTLLFELVGTAGLYAVFRQANVEAPLWQAVFHSVSAFCTAGFSLFSSGLEPFKANFWLNAVISVLSLTGAMGFIVCVDVWQKIQGKKHKVTFTSKIIMTTTFWLIVIGTFLVFVTEPFGEGYPPALRLQMSFFQVMTSVTTVGFNTVGTAELAKSVIFLTAILMIIGASPSGTGGGLKTTTFTSIYGLVKSVLLGREEVRFWRAMVPETRVRVAVASMGLYLSTFAIGVYLLTLTEELPFIEILFEGASALGTVGLSLGITGSLTVLGKIVIIALMYIGRVGPLTFGTALFVKPKLIFDDEKTDLAV